MKKTAVKFYFIQFIISKIIFMPEIPKTYNPREVEDKIYKIWEESGYFNPDNLDLPPKAEKFSVAMPPPNVTGILHLGHALENSLMDTMIRYQRMQGKKALLIPGTDHAAVATQAKVESDLVKSGKYKNPRQELGREKLLEIIRDFAEQSKATILGQIRKMGTSCDWDRMAYTFDKDRTRAVNEVFARMYRDGLIYRGYRVVNWSVKGQSTCSDEELVYVERTAKLYTFKYSKEFPISIATTRPETKLGDMAVAVNPKDKRYKKYIGQTFIVDIGAAKPLKIKIIADESMDIKFGTGAVGVTPAHSMTDYDLYVKHKLELVQVISKNGKMTAEAGKEYQNLSIEEARKKFVKWLEENKLLIKEEDITQNVGISDRFGDVVEVLPMTQWFVGVNKKIPGKEKCLKDLMREAVTVGHNGDAKQKIKITPDRFGKIYLNWIDNLRDWCISRQIWWGHRIPVWYRDKSQIPNPKSQINLKSEIQNSKADQEIYIGTEPPKSEGWTQDIDTLDTWFSSGLWTFSTLGWPASAKATTGKPEKLNDLKEFHPTSWMQMGSELVFFWMARMILMSTYAIDQIPFKEVYIHGILRDKAGRKFSKSLGNGIDPLEIIKKYGADALRLSLIIGATPGNDMRFFEERVEGYRNFVNKLWNISRYILQTKNDRANTEEIAIDKLTPIDKWILVETDVLIKEVGENINSYNFSQAGEKLQDFTRNYFADWYIEASKLENSPEKQKILINILKILLKLWHPFIPFVTETVWKKTGERRLLMIEKWPKEMNIVKLVKSSDIFYLVIKDIISAIRNARAENKIEPSKKIKAVIYAGRYANFIKENETLIRKMRTGIGELEIKKAGKKIDNAIYLAVGGIDIYLPLEGMIDFPASGGSAEGGEIIRALVKKIDKGEKQIDAINKNLADKNFLAKAPAKVVEEFKKRIKAEKENIAKLNERKRLLSNQL